ncbi:MAG: fumarylacetoacetate hydrolase family protein [Dehalococcoidales bacterium]|nr:fumarylacetoacetate hydrolase family protein [Dehalococcoidales bacterium]
MKIVRFQEDKSARYGLLEGNEIFSLEGDLLGKFQAGKKLGKLEDVRLLAPVQPNLVVGLGGNYHSLLAVDTSIHSKPEAFLKPPSAVIGHLDQIIYPQIVTNVHMEGELAVIMKREARHVPEEDAFDYILGYTCANDVTAHIEGDRGSTRAKSFYTFCPLGPCIATGLDPDNLKITSRLNGELVQEGDPTSDMVFNVRKIISYITEFMALRPLDVVLTGTSRPPKMLKAGDVVEIEIEGIGLLSNSVVE